MSLLSLNTIGQTVFESRVPKQKMWTDVGHIRLIGGWVTRNLPKNRKYTVSAFRAYPIYKNRKFTVSVFRVHPIYKKMKFAASVFRAHLIYKKRKFAVFMFRAHSIYKKE